MGKKALDFLFLKKWIEKEEKIEKEKKRKRRRKVSERDQLFSHKTTKRGRRHSKRKKDRKKVEGMASEKKKKNNWNSPLAQELEEEKRKKKKEKEEGRKRGSWKQTSRLFWLLWGDVTHIRLPVCLWLCEWSPLPQKFLKGLEPRGWGLQLGSTLLDQRKTKMLLSFSLSLLSLLLSSFFLSTLQCLFGF